MWLGVGLMVLTLADITGVEVSAQPSRDESVLPSKALQTTNAELTVRRSAVSRGSKTPSDDVGRLLFTRVRSTQRYMIALVREGYDRSQSFRELVDTLQQSNLIVFVQLGYCAGGRIRSCLVSVNGSQRARHVSIKVDPHTTNDRLIATVAHELQHAVEIAEHPEVIDASSALALYRQIALGRCREGLRECETTRALVTEKKVLEELSDAGR